MGILDEISGEIKPLAQEMCGNGSRVYRVSKASKLAKVFADVAEKKARLKYTQLED